MRELVYEWAKSLALPVIIVAVTLSLVGCSSDGDDAGDEIVDVNRGADVPIVIPDGEPIIIGVSAALTGAIEDQGNEYLDAVIAAINRWQEQNGETIAGHRIEVRAEDNGCTEPDQAVIAARRLVGRANLVGVIGPDCDTGALAAAPLYSDEAVVMITGSTTLTDLTSGASSNSFVFRTSYRNDLEGSLIGLFVVEDLRAESIFVVDDGELSNVDVVRTAKRIMDLGGVRTFQAEIEPGSVDFSSLVDEVIAADTDFVAFAGFNPEAALFYRQLRDAGYEGGFGATGKAASQVDFIDPLGDLAENVLFSGCAVPLAQEYLDEFEDLHGHLPTESFAGQFADATTVLLDAISRVASEEADGSAVIVPSELRDAVRATDIDGLTGPLAFDDGGDRVPQPGDDLEDVEDLAFETSQPQLLWDLGLIPCQVQDGQLVPLGGANAGEIRGFNG